MPWVSRRTSAGILPALVTSPPNQAAAGKGALLTATRLGQIKLNANLVILAACNSGGAAGGEGLSDLARSFFHGGNGPC